MEYDLEYEATRGNKTLFLCWPLLAVDVDVNVAVDVDDKPQILMKSILIWNKSPFI